MNDLISRQAAYDTLTEYYHQKTETQHESLKEALNRVPTIAPEQTDDLSGYSDRLWKIAYERGKKEAVLSAQQWIPCSERMPEEADGKVIICMPDMWPYNGKEQFPNAKHNKRVEMAHYSQHNDRWYFEGGAISGDRPVAWMPLPEPYKEEADDTEG